MTQVAYLSIVPCIEGSEQARHPIERIRHCNKYLAILSCHPRNLRNGAGIVWYVFEDRDCGRASKCRVGEGQSLAPADNEEAPLANSLSISKSPCGLHAIQ